MLTFAEINQQNREFWAAMRPRIENLMADPAIRETAFAALKAEQRTRVPVYHQKTLERALLEAEEAQQRFRAQFESTDRQKSEHIETQLRSQLGRKGGLAKKRDRLQELIIDFVRRQPDLSLESLRSQLEDAERGDVIEEVTEGTIHFVDRHQRSKKAPLSGLKHRLTRARKTVADS